MDHIIGQAVPGSANAAAAELLRRKPYYTTATARQELFFCKDPDFLDRYTDGLRLSGVSDE